MPLIPPFAMYFTVEQALLLSITMLARMDLKGENDAAEPFENCQTRLLYTLWQKLSDETQNGLIEAHDREYDYESSPKCIDRAALEAMGYTPEAIDAMMPDDEVAESAEETA